MEKIPKPVPLCIPSNSSWDPSKGELTLDCNGLRGSVKICPAGEACLEEIGNDLVAVICIAGPARSGKSFLMSQLQDGVSFEIGHSTESTTIGMWVAVCRQPINVGDRVVRLILLDAEGLDAFSFENNEDQRKWEQKLFALCALLSSTLIYNTVKVPTASDLENLCFLATFCDSVLNKTPKEEDDADINFFGRNSPSFLWLVRDFTLRPVIDNKPCDLESFLLHKLNSSRITHKQESNVDLRKIVVNAFQSFKAISIPVPTLDEKALNNLMADENRSVVSEKFLNTIHKVKSFLLSSVQIKKLYGSLVSGKELLKFLSLFVDAVNDECDYVQVERTWISLIKSQLGRLQDQAFKKYQSILNDIELPLSTECLRDRHTMASSEALSHFNDKTRRFDGNIKQFFHSSLKQNFLTDLEKKETENECCSELVCNKLFENLKTKYFSWIMQRKDEVTCKDMQWSQKSLIEEYNKTAKGPKAACVMQEKQIALQETLANMRETFANRATQLAIRSYKAEMEDTSDDLFPCENEQLDRLHNEKWSKCFHVFQRTCDDCDQCRKWVDSLQSNIKELLIEYRNKNKTLSNSLCQTLKYNLLRRHIDPLMDDTVPFNIHKFMSERDLILEEYGRKAKGPLVIEVRKQFEETFNEKMNTKREAFVNSAVTFYFKKYVHAMNKVLENGPYDDDELKEHHNKVSRDIQQQLYDAYRDVFNNDSDRLEADQGVLKQKTESAFQEYVGRNEKASHTLCEMQTFITLNEVRASCHDLLTNESQLLPSLSPTLMKLQNIKCDVIRQFSANAKGPSKLHFEKECKKKVEGKINKSQSIAMEKALKEARKVYQKEIDDYLKPGPFDVAELTRKHNETAECIKEHFQLTDIDMEYDVLRRHKEALMTALEEDKSHFMSKNEDMSLRQCRKVSKEVFKAAKTSTDEIIAKSRNTKFETSHLFNAGAEIRKCKCNAEETYNRDAKGPSKKVIEEELVDDITELLKSVKNIIAFDALHKAKIKSSRMLHNELNESCQNEQSLEERLHSVSCEIIETFNRRCSDIENMEIEMHREKLAEFLEEKTSRALRAHESKSWAKYSKKVRVMVEEYKQSLKSLAVKPQGIDYLLKLKQSYLAKLEKEVKDVDKSFFKEIFEFLIEGLTNVALEKQLNELVTSLAKSYKEKIEDLVQKCQYDEDLLRLKQEKCEKDVIHSFEKKTCQDVSETLLDFFMLKLKESLNKETTALFEKNEEATKQHCIRTAEKYVSLFDRACKDFTGKVTNSQCHDNINIAEELEKLKKSKITNFDRQIKYKTVKEIRNKFLTDLNEILEKAISECEQDAVRKARLCYSRFIKNMTKELPCDEESCDEKENEAATRAMQLLREKCKGISHVTNSDKDLTCYFQDLRSETIALLERKNNQKSKELCNQVMLHLMTRRSRFRNIQNLANTYYKDAKGPQKDIVYKHYESAWTNYFNRGFWEKVTEYFLH